VAAALGRITTSQLDQPLLDVSLDLDLIWPRRLRAVVESRLEPFSDQACAHAFDRPQARPKSSNNSLIAVPEVLGRIGEQQDAGMRKLPRRCLAHGHRVFQLDSFLRRQGDTILHHGRPPALEGRPLL